MMLSLRRQSNNRLNGWIILILALVCATLSGHAQSGGPCPSAGCVIITVKRPGGTSTAIPKMTPVPAPRFIPESGSLPYGTSVGLVVDKKTVGQTIEYSTDNGQSWTVGASFPLLKRGVFMARTREGNRTSTVVSTTLDVHFQRMFVLGNSIMRSSPIPDLGWFNTNGMAASSLGKDFVHVLERDLKSLNPQFQMKLIAGGGFERQFWAFNYESSLNEHLVGYAPDLIVVRIGENMSDEEVVKPEREFKARYRQLLDKLTQYSGRAKVICTTSFWHQARASAMIREVAAERGYAVADLHAVLYNRPDRDSFRAVTEYKDAGVGAHPNDRGMAEIARLIWEKIR